MNKHPYAITLDVGSSLANKTGSWRTERPVYLDRMPPCNNACPAGENVQEWLSKAEEGDYEAAWRQIMVDNPFPAIMGRVCYRPCETACNRATLDEPVGINSVERFLGDEAIKQGWSVTVDAPPSGKRVLIVGAGPSGLSAAYHLAVRGHEVIVRDDSPQAGGMMRYGIPSYRLPRDVVDAEIARIVGLGVRLELGTPVTDLAAALADFDAVFLAVGAHVGRRADIPAGDSARIVDAVSMLAELEKGERPLLGRRVAVYGGGNTAMDVARTARRLGATDAIVVYRRTRERMPAHDIEVQEALEEGVRMRWLSTIVYAGADRVRIEKMRLDETGFPQPTGEFEELDADSVVLALGQQADLALVRDLADVNVKDGVVQVDSAMMTGRRGLFAGGDMVPGERTVTVAVGHGKQAARNIDAWLSSSAYEHPERPELATYDRLNTWYYADAPATLRPQLDAARRITSFDEVTGGLTAETALFEARRCMSCGNCLECDNCFGVCPDNAIIKLGPGKGYEIDLDFCKGCGLCAAECPSGAITMFRERS
ncbi:NAD(P)-binding protein [Kribbella sp. NPDC048928]|uniref:NAD(P)-binding protein n=1 Tax=Kribbella sp. NPDC048928 TaxID=3364111 RepID=UPI00371E943A